MYRLILLSMVAGVLGSMEQTGTCETDISYVPFDVATFSNTSWYLIESLGKSWDGGDCPQSVLSKCTSEHGNVIEALKKFILNCKEYSIPRKVTNSEDCDGAITVNVNPYTVEDTPRVIFYVLSFDVSSHTFLYSCVQNTPDTKTVTAYKFSRCKELSDKDASLLDSISDKYEELKGCDWKTFDHTDCPF